MKIMKRKFGSRKFLFLLPALSLVTLANAGDADKGADVFYDHGCYSCHGYEGLGRTPLVNNVSGIMVNEAVFINFLRQRAELNPTLPANSMPNYGVNALSDEEAQDVYAYVKTLTDNPPETKDIPTFVTILEAAKSDRPEE
jgi:mono/diheme cytochrome c family protein